MEIRADALIWVMDAIGEFRGRTRITDACRVLFLSRGERHETANIASELKWNVHPANQPRKLGDQGRNAALIGEWNRSENNCIKLLYVDYSTVAKTEKLSITVTVMFESMLCRLCIGFVSMISPFHAGSITAISSFRIGYSSILNSDNQLHTVNNDYRSRNRILSTGHFQEESKVEEEPRKFDDFFYARRIPLTLRGGDRLIG